MHANETEAPDSMLLSKHIYIGQYCCNKNYNSHFHKSPRTAVINNTSNHNV